MQVCVTGRDGTVRVEVPIGQVHAAISSRVYDSAWVGADQEVEITLQVPERHRPR